jgi:hypothetical protein
MSPDGSTKFIRRIPTHQDDGEAHRAVGASKFFFQQPASPKAVFQQVDCFSLIF